MRWALGLILREDRFPVGATDTAHNANYIKVWHLVLRPRAPSLPTEQRVHVCETSCKLIVVIWVSCFNRGSLAQIVEFERGSYVGSYANVALWGSIPGPGGGLWRGSREAHDP